jgi:hypothetical protein
MTDDLIEKLTTMAGDMGSLIAGAPDETVAPSLAAFRASLLEMLASTLDPAAAELEVVVGSKEKKALWQEMGTSRSPPRPVLRLALHNALPFGRDVLRKISASLVSRRSIDR